MDTSVINFVFYNIKTEILKVNLNIKNYRKKMTISILLDLLIYILFCLLNYSISGLKINYVFTFIILLWIFVSYILGRYHDFKNINRQNILKNIFKTLIISFIFIKIFILSEKLFALESYYLNTFSNISYFLYIYGLLSSIINLFFNFIFYKNKTKKKWFILESNRLLKYLEDDNIEGLDYLSNNLIFIKNINNINTKNLENILGIILEKNIVLNSQEEKIILMLKKRGILSTTNIEWCEKFLYRIPPIILVEESNTIIYPKSNIFQQRIKNINEIFISLLILLFSLPIIILAAFLIYREDKGKIFYSQIRKGLYGKNIRIFKLRTMKVDSEKEGVQWSQKNDSRITKIGYFLRKTRIDEIPQLISVLKGEMSLIGPRPERPEIDIELKKNIPCYENRYNIKPGISGWAQVNYPYGASVQDSYNKLSYDLFYVRNFSNFIDLLILFKTIRVVVKYENASFDL